MSRSIALAGLESPSSTTSRHQRTPRSATLTLLFLSATWGCADAERTFGAAVGARADAGDAGRDVSTEPRETSTDAIGPSSSSGIGDTNESAENTLSPDGGSVCVPIICPQNTDCRSYRAVNCAGGSDTDCEIIDEEADTSCDTGNGSCNGHGECVVPNLAVLGSVCESDDQCGSHHCATRDGGERVCCDTACDGECTTCSAEGHCDATPNDDVACGELDCDESTVCVGFPADVPVATCSAFGQCSTAETYCTPDYTAVDVECGDGLVCDGEGGCVVDCPDPGPDRLCTPECPCETGQGLCTSNDQCADGFVCSPDAVAKLGFPASSCLPAHCVNDQKDAEETSVDCGGGCGCRATYEVVLITGVPEGAGFGTLSAMSGDGSAFAGNIGRDDGGRFTPSYPARVDASGVVTELYGFGVSGNAFGINADGSVVVGDLYCDNPPDCTTAELYRPFRWTNDESPEVVFHNGSGMVVSASGAVVAGTQYDPQSGTNLAFRSSVNHWLDIPELNHVVGMSADGEYIAGRSSIDDAGAVWSTTLEGLVELSPPSEWLSWGIDAISDDGGLFVGSAYVDNTAVKPAYVWRDGTFSEFPKLPGADYNQFGAVSADGAVAVGLSGTNSVQRAFIWDKESGIRTVLAETVARGLELPVDLELTNVDFLSDDGTILVGWVYGTETRSFWRVTLLP
jgi:uncharacterized membrane protein